MTAAERAIADVLTFRRFWGDAWALERIETAAWEIALELGRHRSEERERTIQEWLRCGLIDEVTARQLRGIEVPAP